MSVFKVKKSPFYQYEFQRNGHRFHGTTKCTSRREAEAVERAEIEKAEAELKASRNREISLKLDDIFDRYFEEVGKHHVGADTTERDLARLIEFFGPTRLITEITDNDVTRLVAWRRGHVVKGRKDGRLVSPSTVNRSCTEVLKKVFTRCKLWKIRFEDEPTWKRHFLEEPEEIVRELQDDEGERLDEAMREDFAPLMRFVHISGLRQKEAVLLKWSQVNWDERVIAKLGKRGKRVIVQINDAIREVLWPLRGHHPEAVFTYVAARTRDGRVKGQRLPMTVSGVKTMWRRRRAKAGVEGFRFHDFRHDIATKVVRATGNLKLAQKVLNHRNIRTTARYAHVIPDEVADAMQAFADRSREKARDRKRKVG